MTQNLGRDESVGARPIGAPAPRRGAAAWLLPLLVVLAGIVVLLLLSRCGSGSDASSAGAIKSPSSSSAPTGTASAESTTPSPSGTAGTGGGSGGGTGTITADGTTVLPLTGSSTSSLSKYAGRTAKSTSVAVQSVPADEGFWVGSSSSDRVWVQLTGEDGESPYKVKTGDSVTFTGKVDKNTKDFAGTVGVTTVEGKSQLDAQGYHIDVTKSSLKLAS